MIKNKNLNHIQKQLSFASKKWFYLENEFDQILNKIEGAWQDIKNMAKTSPSTLNLIELFIIHSRVSERLHEDVEPQEACLICLDPLFDQSTTLEFLSQ